MTGTPHRHERPHHVCAISLLEHDGEQQQHEALDHFARKFNGTRDPMAPACRRDGLALWRVSSVDDLVRRLSHLEDGSLETLDIVGHASYGQLGVGTSSLSVSERHLITPDRASFEHLAVLRSKFKLRDASPCLRLVGCSVGSYLPGKGDIPGSQSGPALLLALSNLLGVTVMGAADNVFDFDPVEDHKFHGWLEDDLTWVVARHQDREHLLEFPQPPSPAGVDASAVSGRLDAVETVRRESDDGAWADWSTGWSGVKKNLNWERVESGVVLALGNKLIFERQGGGAGFAQIARDGTALVVVHEGKGWFIPTVETGESD